MGIGPEYRPARKWRAWAGSTDDVAEIVEELLDMVGSPAPLDPFHGVRVKVLRSSGARTEPVTDSATLAHLIGSVKECRGLQLFGFDSRSGLAQYTVEFGSVGAELRVFGDTKATNRNFDSLAAEVRRRVPWWGVNVWVYTLVVAAVCVLALCAVVSLFALLSPQAGVGPRMAIGAATLLVAALFTTQKWLRAFDLAKAGEEPRSARWAKGVLGTIVGSILIPLVMAIVVE